MEQRIPERKKGTHRKTALRSWAGSDERRTLRLARLEPHVIRYFSKAANCFLNVNDSLFPSSMFNTENAKGSFIQDQGLL